MYFMFVHFTIYNIMYIQPKNHKYSIENNTFYIDGVLKYE